jgi:hypothetical protein
MSLSARPLHGVAGVVRRNVAGRTPWHTVPPIEEPPAPGVPPDLPPIEEPPPPPGEPPVVSR